MGLVLDLVNSLYHIPVVGDYLLYGYWTTMLLLAPFVGLAIIVHDVFSGHIWTLIREKPDGDKVVVITGCDRGFGFDLAVRCVAQGFKTYAGCLTQKGCDELKAKAPGVHAVLLDVTKPEQVQAVATQVALENPQGLYALVNNAGISRSGMFDWLQVDEYRAIMEVSFYGVLNVCKAFLPQVKRREGRIINVSSVTGVAMGCPMVSPYAVAKHALEVFTSTIRMELKPFNVKVVTINPGFHRTELHKETVSRTWEQYQALPPEIKTQYPPGFAQGAQHLNEHFISDAAWDPKHVVDALEQALVARWPRAVYSVGLDALMGTPILAILPKRASEWIMYNILTPSTMHKVDRDAAKRAPLVPTELPSKV